ncbi:MAG: PAS domain S-box protein [candidate division Zixibacteria bacterium]|nr:PAS domain S-box protein [candidate division Zixibacteria bacterium]
MKDNNAAKKLLVKKPGYKAQPINDTENIESYKCLLENVPIGLYRSRITDGKLLECNIQFANILGYDNREECLSDYIVAEHYVDSEARDRMLAEIRKHGEIRDFEAEFTAKDGIHLWLKFSARITNTRNCIEGFIEDISEKKLAEEKQQQNSEQYHSIFQSVNDGLLIYNLNGKIIEANSAACKIYGYSHQEILSLSGKDIAHPEYNHIFENFFRQTIDKGQFCCESVDISKDGSFINIEVHGTSFNYHGKPHLLAIIRDITERKKAEATLKEKERHHRRIIETMNDGFGVQDINGNLTYVNDKLCIMLGYNRDELIGHQVKEFLDNNNQNIYQAQNAMQDCIGRHPYELVWTTKDKHRINTIISPAPLFDAEGKFTSNFAVITDITNRKKAEKALRESEEKFREVVEMLPEIVWEIDMNGSVTFVNNRGYEISGYTQEDVDNGFNAAEFFIPADRTRLKTNIEKLLRGELYRFDDYTALRKNGSTFPVIAQAAAIIKEGKPVGVRGFLIDITERKKAEEETKNAHAELEQILNSTPDGIRIIDKEFNVLRVNETFCKLSGIDYKENKKLKCHEALRGSKCLTPKCPLNRILKGEEYIEYDVERERLDGKKIPCILTAVPFYGQNGELIGIIESFKDITERKRAETELYRFARAVKQSLDGIAMIGLDGTIQFINNAWAKMHLYNPEEVHGKHLRIFHTKEQLNKEILPTLKIIEQGYGWEGEVSHVRKDGTVFPTWTTVTLLRNRDARPIGLVCNARDITGRKRAEGQLKKSLKEKEVLIKEIHHRVKNNLQIISSLLELQSDYIKDNKACKIIKTSQDRVKLMALIHEQLYQSPDLAKIGFAMYVRNLADYLVASYGINSDVIKLEKDLENVYLGIDAAIPCGLIINELITNSIKHAFPDNRPGTIRVELRSLDNHFVITVSDDGIGLPENIDSGNTKSLGLQLVNLLEKQTGCTIELDRSHGTAFKITCQKPNS